MQPLFPDNSLGIEHDRRYKLNYKVHSVEVRQIESGELGVWVEVEIAEEDQQKIENKKAFSISLQERFHHPDPTNTKPRLTIAIDPAHFDEETIQSTIKELEQHFAVEASYLYQLSDNVTLIGAIFNIAENAAGNLLALGVYAGIQRLLTQSKGNKASAIIVEKANKKITLENIDSGLLKRAIDRLIPSERNYKRRIAHKQLAHRQTFNRAKNRKRSKSR